MKQLTAGKAVSQRKSQYLLSKSRLFMTYSLWRGTIPRLPCPSFLAAALSTPLGPRLWPRQVLRFGWATGECPIYTSPSSSLFQIFISCLGLSSCLHQTSFTVRYVILRSPLMKRILRCSLICSHDFLTFFSWNSSICLTICSSIHIVMHACVQIAMNCWLIYCLVSEMNEFGLRDREEKCVVVVLYYAFPSESLAPLFFIEPKWTCRLFLLVSMRFWCFYSDVKSLVVSCYTCICISFVLKVSAQIDLSIHLFSFWNFCSW